MRISRAKRIASARKAARTRTRNKAKRRAAAMKSVRTRRAKHRVAAKKHFLNRSPI